MEEKDAISGHDEEAADYDAAVAEYEWYGYDFLFGMAYEYVKPGEGLLDIGIGTGLASAQFARAGLKVTGIDGAPKMLEECRSKGFAEDLRVFDLNSGPLPFADGSFDHAVCCGVLHFFGDISKVFAEVSRVVRPHGVFAFTNRAFDPYVAADAHPAPEGYVDKPVEGVSIYVHEDGYIERLLSENGFTRLKGAYGLVRMEETGASYLTYRAWIVGRDRPV